MKQKNFEKIEFIMTYACTGRCRHCSQGDAARSSAHLDAEKAIRTLRLLAGENELKTVLTFGGEPLLYWEDVCKIQAAAKELQISKRQVITNGYFSKDLKTIGRVAKSLGESGVNDLLLSVDAFHQEFIPKEPVMAFAEAALAAKIPIRLQPAWLVRPDAENPYNCETRRILEEFSALGLKVGEGNVIFPEGNAKRYLHQYFQEGDYQNPYEQDEAAGKTLSVDPFDHF